MLSVPIVPLGDSPASVGGCCGDCHEESVCVYITHIRKYHDTRFLDHRVKSFITLSKSNGKGGSEVGK